MARTLPQNDRGSLQRTTVGLGALWWCGGKNGKQKSEWRMRGRIEIRKRNGGR